MQPNTGNASGVCTMAGDVFNRTAVDANIGQFTICQTRQNLDIAAITQPSLEAANEAGDDHDRLPSNFLAEIGGDAECIRCLPTGHIAFVQCNKGKV